MAVVGRDPRASGEFLEAAVVAGLAGSGVDVLRLGVIPTPGGRLPDRWISAPTWGSCCRPATTRRKDNGIKLFARGGFKLPDAVEDEIEAQLGHAGRGRAASARRGFGRVSDAVSGTGALSQHLLASLPAGGTRGGGPGMVSRRAPLAGLRVVVDCAHGAASAFAPGCCGAPGPR